MNPYESPETESPREPRQVKKSGILLRTLAVLLWLIGTAPTVIIAARMAQGDLPPGFGAPDPAYWIGIGIGMLLFCGLPFTGFGLLGLSAWRLSWRLAIPGAIIALACVAVFAAVAILG